MDKFIAQRVMSGTQGEIWIDGKYMAELTYSPCLKAGDSWIQTIFAH